MKSFEIKSCKTWILILFLALVFSPGGLVAQAPAKAAKGMKGTFTLEEVLSAPYPLHLVSAKKADRIAWVFHTEGAKNI